MERGQTISFYSSAKRTEKLIAYAIKKGKGKPVPLNSVMNEIVDFFFEVSVEDDIKHNTCKKKGK